MKRYFDMSANKQVVMIEFDANQIARNMSIKELFDSEAGITEITKREYIILNAKYKCENETNLTMTVSR